MEMSTLPPPITSRRVGYAAVLAEGIATVKMPRLALDMEQRFAEAERRIAALHDPFDRVLVASPDSRERAEPQYRRALRLLEDLVGEEPENRTWQRDLVYARTQLAKLMRHTGSVSQAEALLSEARSGVNDLLAAPSPSFEWRRLDLEIALLELAMSNEAAGTRTVRADRLLEKVSELRQERSDDRSTLVLALELQLLRGDLIAADGANADARAHWSGLRHSIACFRVDDPRVPDATAVSFADIGSSPCAEGGGSAPLDPRLQHVRSEVERRLISSGPAAVPPDSNGRTQG